MSLSVRNACLSAAALFAGLAVLIARLAVSPIGAADLLGVAACAAAAGAFTTLAFALRPAGTQNPAAIDATRLAEQISAAVESRLAASEDRRRDEILRAAQAARPEPVATPELTLTTDQIPAPAPAAKPRLGRGLSSLIHNPAALSTKPAAPAPAGEDERAAA